MTLHIQFGEDAYALPPGDLTDIHENTRIRCDHAVRLRWREVGTGESGAVYGPWNALRDAAGRELLLPSGTNLAHPPGQRTQGGYLDVGSFGRRLTTGHFEVHLTAEGSGGEARLALRPVHAHLTPEEVAVMVGEVEDDDLAWDGRAAGFEGPEAALEHLGEEERVQGRRKTSREPTPWEQAQVILDEWPALPPLLEEAVRFLPTQAQWHRRRGPAHALRQDHRSIERNVREGRLVMVSGVAQATTSTLHGLSAGRTTDTPAAAELVRTVEELNGLRRAVLRSMYERRQHTLARQDLERRYQADGGRIATVLRAKFARLQELIQALEQLEPLRVPASLRDLDSVPSRSTAAARFHPAHQAWYRAADALARTCRAHFAPQRLRRIERTARRQTWHLYEIWMTRRVVATLVRLGFAPQQPWSTLESTEGSLYGLQEGATLVLEHLSGLEVHLTVEPSLPNPTGDPWRPDVVLELAGNLRNPRTALPLVPLILDAKLKRLTWVGHQPQIASLIRDVRDKYRSAWHAHQPHLPAGVEPMVFVCCPSPQVNGIHVPWSVWPVAAPDGGVPAPLQETDLPYMSGALNLHPHPPTHAERLDDPDLRRVILAWLVQNRVFWICPRCGENLTRFHDPKLHRLARSSPRGDPRCAEPRIGYIKRPDGTVERRATRVTLPRNLHIPCPTCKALTVVSHCGSCKDERGQRPVIHKYFGDYDQTLDQPDPDVSLWSRIEVSRLGAGNGIEGRWNRPCPKCGATRRGVQGEGIQSRAT